jgi:hypothetical protein
VNVMLIYPHWPETYWSFRHALKLQGKRADTHHHTHLRSTKFLEPFERRTGRHNGKSRQARGVDTYLGVVLLDLLSGSEGVLLDAGTPYHCAQATDCNHPIGCWAAICHAFVSAALFLRP